MTSDSDDDVIDWNWATVIRSADVDLIQMKWILHLNTNSGLNSNGESDFILHH